MRIIRISILVILTSLTIWFIFIAGSTTPDPHYGRTGAVMFYGLLTFLIWIPYNIICMFVDKNKKHGFAAIMIVILTLGSLGLAIAFRYAQAQPTQSRELNWSICALGVIFFTLDIGYFLLDVGYSIFIMVLLPA
ncbi:MAG: hypothetical protein KOO69_08755 [Victivallales bacterium]|nr:hypothetical protein [Victivallales bacterium]